MKRKIDNDELLIKRTVIELNHCSLESKLKRKEVIDEPPCDPFYADLIYKPIPTYDEKAIGTAVLTLGVDALRRCCPDFNYCFQGETVFERLVCSKWLSAHKYFDLIDQYPDISLLPLLFRPNVSINKEVRARVLTEGCQFIGVNLDLKSFDIQLFIRACSLIMGKWNKLSPFIQRRMGLIRLRLMMINEQDEIIRFIPPWITHVCELGCPRIDANSRWPDPFISFWDMKVNLRVIEHLEYNLQLSRDLYTCYRLIEYAHYYHRLDIVKFLVSRGTMVPFLSNTEMNNVKTSGILSNLIATQIVDFFSVFVQDTILPLELKKWVIITNQIGQQSKSPFSPFLFKGVYEYRILIEIYDFAFIKE